MQSADDGIEPVTITAGAEGYSPEAGDLYAGDANGLPSWAWLALAGVALTAVYVVAVKWLT